jgi:hypothetical protein
MDFNFFVRHPAMTGILQSHIGGFHPGRHGHLQDERVLGGPQRLGVAWQQQKPAFAEGAAGVTLQASLDDHQN